MYLCVSLIYQEPVLYQKELEDRLDKLVQEDQDSSASVANDMTSAHGRRLKKKCLDIPFLEAGQFVIQ